MESNSESVTGCEVGISKYLTHPLF